MTTAQKISALIQCGECDSKTEAAHYLLDMGEISCAAADRIQEREALRAERAAAKRDKARGL